MGGRVRTSGRCGRARSTWRRGVAQLSGLAIKPPQGRFQKPLDAHRARRTTGGRCTSARRRRPPPGRPRRPAPGRRAPPRRAGGDRRPRRSRWPEAPGIDAIVLDVGLPGPLGPRGRAAAAGRAARASRSSCSPPATRLGPGRRARLRRRRLPREAVRDRGAGGAGPGARPARSQRQRHAAGTRRSRAGPIALDEASRVVTVDGGRVDLSPREFALLECLLRHRGQVLIRDQLLDHAWPYDTRGRAGDRRHLRLLPAPQARRRRRRADRDGPRHRLPDGGSA